MNGILLKESRNKQQKVQKVQKVVSNVQGNQTKSKTIKIHSTLVNPYSHGKSGWVTKLCLYRKKLPPVNWDPCSWSAPQNWWSEMIGKFARNMLLEHVHFDFFLFWGEFAWWKGFPHFYYFARYSRLLCNILQRICRSFFAKWKFSFRTKLFGHCNDINNR